jgi:hypothetical protein
METRTRPYKTWSEEEVSALQAAMNTYGPNFSEIEAARIACLRGRNRNALQQARKCKVDTAQRGGRGVRSG